MRRTSLIAAAIGGLLVTSSSFAGFTVTATLGATVDGLDRWDVVAVNTGGDTGVQIKGLEYFYAGSPAAFQVDDVTDSGGGDPNGVADTVNLLSTSRTRIRVSATAANNVFVGVSPSNEFAEPNPYAAGAAAFQGAIANTGTTNASGAGFQVARIFIPAGGSGVFSGNIGGDIGSKVGYSVTLGGGPGGNDPVIVNDGASTTATFGQIVTNGAPFSIVIQGTDADAGDILSLAVGALPAGVSNVTVSPATSGSPANFTVSGTVDYSLNGTTVNVPITLTSTQGTADTGSFNIVVVPEPTSLAALGLSGLLLGRRRK